MFHLLVLPGGDGAVSHLDVLGDAAILVLQQANVQLRLVDVLGLAVLLLAIAPAGHRWYRSLRSSSTGNRRAEPGRRRRTCCASSRFCSSSCVVFSQVPEI